MLALLAFAYVFPKDAIRYDVNVRFNGFLPVFGGQEGSAEIFLGISVKGVAEDADGNPQAESELVSAKVKFMGETLPFNEDNMQSYFPKTTVSFHPLGKMLKTNAPDVQLPIRLPGLDLKRFPEITYLPIEFPKETLVQGQKWTFIRSLGGADATYTVTATTVDDTKAELSVEVAQTAQTLENEALELVKKEEDAVAKIETSLTGKGTVTFDRNKNLATLIKMNVDAASNVLRIKGGEKSTRKLQTTLEVKLKE
ncbi:MAG TPA: hypothetical protein PKA27_00715 [Fimbriimonadaceae bacterium]|nr:hypothetical protein [Fimbriimonadaceae bacterium]